MGYYVNIDDSTVVLPTDKFPEILARWKEMNDPKYDDQKRGGSWGEGKKKESWYSWMPADYDKTVTSVAEMLELLRFEFSVIDDNSLSIDGYDSKAGQEDLFFAKIADLIPAGQYITWRGEDGEVWRWFFTGTEMKEQAGRVVFDEI